MTTSFSSDDARPGLDCLGIALGLSCEKWENLGLGDSSCSNRDKISERLHALLVVRIIAWMQPQGTFADLSTTTVCRSILTKPSLWPVSVDTSLILALKEYVDYILNGYGDPDVIPYHNVVHCYHVTISSNKMLDMILNTSEDSEHAYTYGLRNDPLMQLVIIFSALIHDVEHRGIPNRRLVIEEDELALIYNDQSVAEMRSIFVAFTEFKKAKYDHLRNAVFPSEIDYRRFRDATIDLVLATDLASPDRAQVVKSKWKEAFGDPYETVERKIITHRERRASVASKGQKFVAGRASRRMSAQSILSELTLDPSSNNVVDGNLDDDTSLSVTPDSSDNEDDKAMKELPEHSSPNRVTSKVRKQSFDSMPRTGTSDASAHSATGRAMTGMALKFQRRLSAVAVGPHGGGPSKRSRPARIGLLRTVDLSGEQVETYRPHDVRASATGATTEDLSVQQLPTEEIDHLREFVVMETIMRAADVAHNLQGWDQMATWSNHLYMELKKASIQQRGDDPEEGWNKNQVGFLDAYVLPLARKLDDCGVFGDTRGSIFAHIVNQNKERWIREGVEVTEKIVTAANERISRNEL